MSLPIPELPEVPELPPIPDLSDIGDDVVAEIQARITSAQNQAVVLQTEVVNLQQDLNAKQASLQVANNKARAWQTLLDTVDALR